MTYEEALAYWFGRINYEQRSPHQGDFKLDHMFALLLQLDNPHRQTPIVHIAGSKGKGSTAAMLASTLTKAGYRTGLFTSPHLCAIEERIQIDGQSISQEEIARLMEQIAVAEKNMDHKSLGDMEGVTFFEVATALGFLAFAQKKVDLAVVEVGLGGRFDATNVSDPLLAIITSISLDHTRQLGNRLASIAFEKAGIIKPHRPIISGVCEKEPRDVIRQVAMERNAHLYELGREFHYTYQPGSFNGKEDRWPRVAVTTEENSWPEMPLKLLGEHQAANSALVVAAVEELRRYGYTIPTKAVRDGLWELNWPARLEIVQRRPMVILDCAHNVASAQALLKTLQSTIPGLPTSDTGSGKRRRLLIFAGTNDKDLSGMLRELAPQFDHAFFTQYRNNPRLVPAGDLAKLLPSSTTLPYTLCETSEDAWEQARKMATPEDLICITGSVFLAGELRPLLLAK